MAADAKRWNHNIHYQRLILDALPPGARTALDVGAGNGLLAAELHQRIPQVVGLDIDAAVLRSTRGEYPGVSWLLGDVMTYPFPPASFDVVASVAALHQLPDLELGLARLAYLNAPGGVVAVVGLARSSSVTDFVYDLVGLVQHQYHLHRLGFWEHSAPTVAPPHTYADVRRAAIRALPGARWSRLPLWRYSLIWHKPRWCPA